MKYTTLYTLILGLFSIGWTDCPEDFMERMQRPGHSEIQLSKVTISGRVLDESGFPLAGATIQEKETANGAIADSEGKFTLVVADNAVLRVSFIGYISQDIEVEGRSTFHITLREDMIELDNVIVTALGIEKKENSLSYATDLIKNEELTRVKMPNLITSLTGKSAGVRVNQVSSGLGASAKVSIRGIRSVASDNQPLYVIDGVPILNSTSEQAYSAIGGTANAGNRDGGDGISNLNPEDIESISILKGAPAAALYGSQAANGVILITTKKGQSHGQRSVSFSTSLMFDNAFALPKMQNRYGVSDGVDSWGERANLPEYDNLRDFFSTGVTSITSISLSHGNEKLQNYFSYANTTGHGIIGKHNLSKHNLTFRETSVLLNSRLKLDGSMNLMRQVVKNKPTVGGFYMNPLVGLYRFPRGEDIAYYKENFEVYDEGRNLNIQNWHTSYEDFEQNPYWITNRILSKENRMHVIVSLSANLKINDWLSLQARGNVDYINDKVRQQFYASTAPALAGANGRYIEMDYQETQYYGDAILMMKKQWDAFSLNAALGASINDKTVNSTRYDSKLVKGGSIGDIYGKAFVRDDAGNIVYGTEGDNTGMPLVEGDGNTVKVGNANPKLMLGWNHMLSYKNFSFYFLVDCRFGGDILSQTQADMDMYGVSEVTARARDKGYVMLEGNRIDNVKGFYKNVVGGRAGVTEYYIYDATNIRLRELSVGYQLPAAWMEKTKVLKRAQLSFSGRNLFFFYKKAPFDPDLVLSTGNDNQGIEVYGMPTTRSWGFSLKCEF